MLGIKKTLCGVGDIRFLIPLKKQISIDGLNIVASGSISTLALCTYSEVSACHQLSYNVENCISLNERIRNIEAYAELLEIIRSYFLTIIDCDKANINVCNLLLKSRYIFWDGNRTVFICLPFENKNKKLFNAQLSKFLKAFRQCGYKEDLKIFKKVRSAEEGLSILNDCLINSIDSVDLSSSEADTTFLQSDKNNIPISSETDTTFLTPQIADMNVYGSNPDLSLSEDMNSENSFCSLESETTVLTPQVSARNETTVLSRASALTIKSFVIRNKTGEITAIEKPVFTIGKSNSDSLVDFVVSDNRSISRHHASIVVENDTLYLVDNNSTNKSYVEGAIAKPYEKNELNNGAMFSLADEVFQVFIEER